MRFAVAVGLLWVGVGLELLAVLGVCVMRDAFDRLHCVSLAGYGALVIAVSILVRESFSLIGDKALLTGALVVLLSPVMLHTTMRSLRIRLYGDWRRGDQDDIAIERTK
ncbi:MAG TPA: monovalent cation/H(+) antiporter subunit G [Solirubrobacteraceae bacterium]|jgi:multisubunit Na+/H+ antiporter MnhG subunit|nr:monovalent cation/H(+) antiporter subunit G [Solirubrobacteraceae bacterium]